MDTKGRVALLAVGRVDAVPLLACPAVRLPDGRLVALLELGRVEGVPLLACPAVRLPDGRGRSRSLAWPRVPSLSPGWWHCWNSGALRVCHCWLAQQCDGRTGAGGVEAWHGRKRAQERGEIIKYGVPRALKEDYERAMPEIAAEA
jgi:hypothetical protein